MPVPAAIVPMPTSIADIVPGLPAITVDQLTVAAKYPATSRVKAPKIHVAHFCTLRIKECPATATITVSKTKTRMALLDG